MSGEPKPRARRGRWALALVMLALAAPAAIVAGTLIAGCLGLIRTE